MELLTQKLLLISLLLLIGIEKHSCCHEAERLALLQLKSFLKSQTRNDSFADYFILPSWIQDPQSDCCAWERITCNRTTGHPLKELRVLNLSSNAFAGWSDDQDFEGLKKLESLDLSTNAFNETIMSSLTGLISLRKLILARNSFQSFPIEDLSRLKNLEMLDLSENMAFAPFTGSLNLSNLSRLKYLDLRGNAVGNDIFRLLGRLTSLKYLDLSRNQFEGFLPFRELSNLSNLEVLILGEYLGGTLQPQGSSIVKTSQQGSSIVTSNVLALRGEDLATFSKLRILDFSGNQFSGIILPGLCGLNRLEEIDLSNNRFEGILPPCLYNLTYLEVLDLSGNNFIGSVSSSAVASLTSLKYIDLSHNNFEGSFSFSSFANHSKLEVVQFISGNEKFEIETENPCWTPQFQLVVLVLVNCNLNKRTHKIPHFLLHQTKLEVVDLSCNEMEGRFPIWLLANNSRLEYLSVRNNSLLDELYLQHYPLMNAMYIDVSDNQLQGEFQGNVSQLLPQLEYLNLSRNAFEGGLSFSSICDIGNLKVLDLSSNKFLGEVEGIARCTNLEILELSNNNFHGEFFTANYNWSALRVLQLSNNQFTGNLSHTKWNSLSLSLFDVSNNYISGNIPRWIGNITYLEILNMRNNSFAGQLHCEAFSAVYLDLSHNFFSGQLPSCSNTEKLQQIHLQGNNFTGPLPKAFFNSSFLFALNVRDNMLSGNIPDMIDVLSRLRVLLLRGNHFNGSIPKQLCQLQWISLMDLSHNSFSGSIPLCFYNITFGQMMPYYPSIGEISIYLPVWSTIYTYPHKHNGGSVQMNGSSSLGVEIDFVTKNRSDSYKGDILNFMSGLDLSSNKLIGEIPSELGKLTWIRALNLSYNHLTGSIPKTFAGLNQIESLDLSHNVLGGEIPSELTDLYFLSYFSVAFNNLSGRTPDMKAQFSTFDKSSYEGNPFLCGPLAEKTCSGSDDNKSDFPSEQDEADEKWYEIDHLVFLASFSVSFIMFFLGVITILYVNPYWRRRWCYYCEEFMFSCYYFVHSALSKLSAFLHQ